MSRANRHSTIPRHPKGWWPKKEGSIAALSQESTPPHNLTIHHCKPHEKVSQTLTLRQILITPSVTIFHLGTSEQPDGQTHSMQKKAAKKSSKSKSAITSHFPSSPAPKKVKIKIQKGNKKAKKKPRIPVIPSSS